MKPLPPDDHSEHNATSILVFYFGAWAAYELRPRLETHGADRRTMYPIRKRVRGHPRNRDLNGSDAMVVYICLPMRMPRCILPFPSPLLLPNGFHHPVPPRRGPRTHPGPVRRRTNRRVRKPILAHPPGLSKSLIHPPGEQDFPPDSNTATV